jgi:xanthine dehydrogenase YagS FAD-binding subunit
MAVAMVALDAQVVVHGPRGERSIPIAEFHRLPGDEPERDTVLEHGDLVVAVDLPASSFAGRSAYRKVRDRASYAFALVSVAAALDLDGVGGSEATVRDVRLALGGVAHKPWRAMQAEALLAGKALEPALLRKAAAAAVEGAKPYRDNAFKVELAQRAIVRALQTAGGMA